MNSLTSYILAKKYTEETVDGAGWVKGAPCEIESIVPSEDGTYTTVTFKWETTSGAMYTSEMKVDNGDDGLGVKGASIDTEGHLIVTYDDDSIKDAGEIPTKTVEVGDTETLEYDEQAEVTQEDTETGIKLNFKIPRGEPSSADPVWHNV